MYPPNYPKDLVKPRSNLLTEEHRTNKGERKTAQKITNEKPSVVQSLLGICLFLLALCSCAIAILVLVGKSFPTPGVNSYSLPANQSSSHLTVTDLTDNKTSLSSTVIPTVGFKSGQILEAPFSSQEDNTVKSAVTTACAIHANMSKVAPFRLPREFRPKHYKLYLHPNLKEKRFRGNVTINLEILRPISFIPVHMKQLTVSSTQVFKIVNSDLIPVKVRKSFEYPKHEYWITEFEKDLEVGEYSIQYSFNGSLTDRIVGFYQSSYYDEESKQYRSMATSKFEPTYARQAFPCFDEPAMKAKFSITLVRPSSDGYIALSNMNEINQKVNGEFTEVTFKESVPMSTYLACFIVSDFQYKSKKVNSNGIGDDFEMRVFATPAQTNKVDFALDVGVKIIENYIKYYGIEYPLPKLDMAAIPDFVSGAMEHWGLVTFRETALLYDPKISSTVNKQRVASVVAHELAHMWFGNLVTMMWWNDLWLNEGFATYMQYKALHVVLPKWKTMDQFLVDELHGVLKLDATLATHPIVQTVETPDQITELFDTITYSKGASIIRMLENVIGEDEFRSAVTTYLKKFKYNNAVTEDFINSIVTTEKEKVKMMMDTFTKYEGFPLINVKKVSDKEFKLEQQRFFSNPDNDKNQTKHLWAVPITYTTNADNKVQKIWMNIDSPVAEIKLANPVKWIKLNKDQFGYYRVNYDKEMWLNLLEALKDPEVMSSSDRAHLLNDAFTLADASQLSYDVALDLTQYLEKEKEYVPWSVAVSKLIYLKNILYYTDVIDEFLQYSRNLITNIYKRIGWIPGENHLQNRLRVAILNAACELEIPDCLDKASEQFLEWLKDPTNENHQPKQDVRSIVYDYGMRYAGDERAWNKVWTLFIEETDATEKLKLLSSLANVNHPRILQKLINLAWNENNVRRQDYFTCLTYVSKNPIGEDLVWNYVRENWPKLVGRFGLNERYLGRLIPSITSRFSTDLKLEEMMQFFLTYPEAGAGAAARKQAGEDVKLNIKWLETNQEKIRVWLSTQQQNVT